MHKPTMGVTINKRQQQQNNNLRKDSSLSHRGGGGLNAYYWYQIFALDSAVVEVQEMFSLHGTVPLGLYGSLGGGEYSVLQYLK